MQLKCHVTNTFHKLSVIWVFQTFMHILYNYCKNNRNYRLTLLETFQKGGTVNKVCTTLSVT